jgi:TfoX/Sxy family transcriptional regulator of competence genes
MSVYKEQLQNILEQCYPQLANRHTLTFKNCFGAVAGYVDGRIFCSCGVFGIALKLPESDRDEIFSAGGKPLRYFEKGHIKKDYAVIPQPLIADKKSMMALIKKSIKFSSPH